MLYLSVRCVHRCHAQQPFELVAIDSLGPLNETNRGNRHIIVAIDSSTKFVDAAAVPDTTAASLEILTGYCGRYGIPKTILTDGGHLFNNNLIKDALKIFGINYRKSTPNNPQGNSIAEKAIETVTDKLFMICDGDCD